MPVPWLRFPPPLNTFFSYFPHPWLLILSRLPPPQLVWLCFCYALGLHCPLPEDTFPSTLSILSSGRVPSPPPHPEEVDWSFRGRARGSCGSVASAKQVCSSCMESPSTQWSVLFSQALGRGARKALSFWGDGRGSLRKGLTNVWYVGLSKAGRRHPYSSRSLFHCLILGFWGWRMRTQYLTFSLFSDPLISYQCDSIQISLRECQTQIANIVSKADAKLLLISTVALFKAYHQRPRQGQGFNRHPVYFLNEWMNRRNRKDSPWKILVEWADQR